MSDKARRKRSPAIPKATPPRPRGRPSRYTAALAARICAGIASGQSLRAVCRAPGMPDPSTVAKWTVNHRHAFFPQYDEACRARAALWADEIVEIADDSSGDTVETDNGPRANPEFAARSRLRVDARKWIVSKMLPKVYGDAAVKVTATSAPGATGAAAGGLSIVIDLGGQP